MICPNIHPLVFSSLSPDTRPQGLHTCYYNCLDHSSLRYMPWPILCLDSDLCLNVIFTKPSLAPLSKTAPFSSFFLFFPVLLFFLSSYQKPTYLVFIYFFKKFVYLPPLKCRLNEDEDFYLQIITNNH